MQQASNVECRGCLDQNCEALGRLPDCREFAGLSLATPIAGGTLYRCPNCSLVFRAPILTNDEYGELYAKASADSWATRRWTVRNDRLLVRAYLDARFPAGARILDIGCSTGEFLSSLPDRYRKFGIEKSANAARHCRQLGIEIIGDDLHDASRLTERFDVVIAMDVIEHVACPGIFVGQALGLLADNGRVLLTTGDANNHLWRREKANFWYCAGAGHISFISEAWLKGNAELNDFRIDHLQTFRYEDRKRWKAFVMHCLNRVYPMVGLRPHPAWKAHASADHLFAALRR